MNEKWDTRFIALAKHVGQWSHDPSTKCGAIVVRPDKTIASLGFNGFPRGIEDRLDRYADRTIKLQYVVHAELNGILNAREPVKGYTLYTWPLPPCDRCTMHIIQAGIARAVSVKASPEAELRWADSFRLSRSAFQEAGVEMTILDGE